jgi:hypothetical protein
MSINKVFQDKVIRFIRTPQECLVIAKDIFIGSTQGDELKIITAKFEVKKMALKLDTKTRVFYVLSENAALYYLTKKHATQLHNFIRASFAELKIAGIREYKSYMNWLSDEAETCINNNNIVDLRRYTNPNNRAKYLNKDFDPKDKLMRARAARHYLSDWLTETYPFSTRNKDLFWLTCYPEPESKLYEYLASTELVNLDAEDPAISLTFGYMIGLAHASGVQAWPISETWTYNGGKFIAAGENRDCIAYDYTSDKNERIVFKIYI